MEIERKFLIKNLPKQLESYPSKKLEQGYISISPVIRIRKSDNSYILTIKGKGLIAREEHELMIDQAQYKNLSTKLAFPTISKERFLIPFEDYTIELDIFHGHLDGLILAEVEFTSMDEANAFKGPEWFGQDVSLDTRYHNSRLCQMHSLVELNEN